MSLPLLLVLATLATGRATALINYDDVTMRLRTAILAAFGPDSWLYLWVRCPWCVSLWLGAAAAWGTWQMAHFLHLRPGPAWFFIPAVALAMSWVVSLTAVNLDPGYRFLAPPAPMPADDDAASAL